MKPNIVQVVKLGTVASLLAVTTQTIGEDTRADYVGKGHDIVVGYEHQGLMYINPEKFEKGAKARLQVNKDGIVYCYSGCYPPDVRGKKDVAVTQSAGLDDFDSSIFLDNGPHQQGTIKIDRSKIQTVVTWCSPTLLKMRVYDGVNDSYPTLYRKVGDSEKDELLDKLKNDQHPLQVSITVFTSSLPFNYASNYSKPAYVTSVCSPSSIHTTLSSPASDSVKSDSYSMQYDLGKSFKISGKQLAVTSVDCNQGKAGYYETGKYNGPVYGLVGGVATLPAGVGTTVIAHCQSDGFTINIK